MIHDAQRSTVVGKSLNEENVFPLEMGYGFKMMFGAGDGRTCAYDVQRVVTVVSAPDGLTHTLHDALQMSALNAGIEMYFINDNTLQR